jgi:hypothetical protein
MMNQEDQEFQNLFKTYLEPEILDPKVQQGKRQLIERTLSIQPSFVFRPAYLVPVSVFAFLGALFFQYVPLPAVSTQRPAPAPSILCEEDSAASLKQPSVSVRKVTSKVGPTMVYQKNINNVPVTIVWVFTGQAS